MMLRSAEVRWFISGALPGEVLSWFKAGQALDSEGVQVHEYLVFQDCQSVGVKLREGRLEIKAILAASQPLSLEPGIQGRTEEWVKWSFESEGLQTIDPALHQAGCWLKVYKERFLRTFSADGGNLVEVIARPGPELGSLLRMGCNIELTRIEVEVIPRFWFSLGFEAFGPSALATKILLEAIHLFFQGHGGMPGISLGERDSLSYPAWLAKVAKTLEKDNGNFSSSQRR
jgi:hypothetical protein